MGVIKMDISAEGRQTAAHEREARGQKMKPEDKYRCRLPPFCGPRILLFAGIGSPLQSEKLGVSSPSAVLMLARTVWSLQ